MSPDPSIKRIPLSKCLHCGAPFDAIGTPDNSNADLADGINVTVCIKCAAVMGVSKDGTPRRLTDDEIAQIDNDPQLRGELARMVRNIRHMRASRG